MPSDYVIHIIVASSEIPRYRLYKAEQTSDVVPNRF